MEGLVDLAPVIGAVLVPLGAGARWLILTIDRKLADARAREDAARAEVREYLDAQIAQMSAEMAQLRIDNSRLLAHVEELERLIVEHGGTVPVRPV